MIANFRVRVAAARAIGMARDAVAVERLMEMASHDQPAARRQAATALGQIGDARAVPYSDRCRGPRRRPV